MKPEARVLYERGLDLYQKKDYAGATRAFEEGFALDGRREFLFANAQARRLAGDCRGAVPLYQRFLELAPSPLQTSATHIGLARCAQQMAHEKPPAAIPTAPRLPPPLPPPPPPSWKSDRLGAALVGAGVVGLGVGVGFLAAALSARPPDDGGGDNAEFMRRWSVADARARVATVGFVAGGVLVAAGVARFGWAHHREKAALAAMRPPPAVSLSLAPGGLIVGGSF